MSNDTEFTRLANDISNQLAKLESTFWEVYVAPGYSDRERTIDEEYERDDKEIWLYEASKIVYYKICVFLELKGLPIYLHAFRGKFDKIIYDKNKATKARAPLYQDDEPSMVIHDEFREFLSAFPEFDYDFINKAETNKLKLILENTNSILDLTKTVVTNESSIYNPVKKIIEIIYPDTRKTHGGRFLRKFMHYKPDILIPEISAAVEYKYIRKGDNPAAYLDQLKIDSDNYKKDPDYRFFYAVVYFESKGDINPAAFNVGVKEKEFSEQWTFLAL